MTSRQRKKKPVATGKKDKATNENATRSLKCSGGQSNQKINVGKKERANQAQEHLLVAPLIQGEKKHLLGETDWVGEEENWTPHGAESHVSRKPFTAPGQFGKRKTWAQNHPPKTPKNKKKKKKPPPQKKQPKNPHPKPTQTHQKNQPLRVPLGERGPVIVMAWS